MGVDSHIVALGMHETGISHMISEETGTYVGVQRRPRSHHPCTSHSDHGLLQVGAALFEGVLQPAMDVAIIGLGGAGRIIAVDLVQEKVDLALRLGAIAGLLAGADTIAAVQALTEGRGVDVVFEVGGRPEVMGQAIDMPAPGGTLMLVGAAARDAQLHLAPRRFMSRRQRIQGCIYGVCRPSEHLPLFARWPLDGILQIRPLIWRTLDSLHEITEAFSALQRGELLRAVLVFPSTD